MTMGSTQTPYNATADAARTILLFGPQAVTFGQSSLDKLRYALREGGSARYRWALDTVDGLGRYWEALVQKIPAVAEVVHGEKLLADLHSWLRDGGEPAPQHDGTNPLPNTVLTPLVVLTQLTRYWRYLEAGGAGAGAPDDDTDLHANLVARQTQSNNTAVETLGFCTGLLSAFAVASAANEDELQRYGAVAVRLAMLVGALVDAQEAWGENKHYNTTSASHAVAWKNAGQRAELGRALDELAPEAYISVLYDESRATVTTSQRAAPRLLSRLRAEGITTAEVGLHGRFHNPEPAVRRYVELLMELCSNQDGLQFREPARLVLPSYTNNGGSASDADALHEVALRSMLMQQCDWYGTCGAALREPTEENDLAVVCFSPDRCVPPTLARRISPRRMVHFAELDDGLPNLEGSRLDPEATSRPTRSNNVSINSSVAPTEVGGGGGEEPIAVIGVSIKVAGADDAAEFAEMLRRGESQHEEIGPERLMMDTLFREVNKDPSRKWYGNFIRDGDAFDHKFFKRSPREAATMDPQQRLFLQAAYQAVEQSGYFTEGEGEGSSSSGSGRDKRQHVGVYLGACAGDYEHHAACHTPNAFTATGNLKSFIPGKVSHYFGWTGPAMTFDTACSASAVAIHTACRNLLSGECTAALAGGVATMTNFLWFQNLAGASFLSPTGQCKPFDEQADGYCRAEGIACVFLKKLSDAVADGNTILGCLASTAVYQNQNCTPLFVPNSPSLSQLFRDVVAKARLDPRDVSLVEAHGTGTPVGDPAEYESVRLALGGPIRARPLVLGSVKGHVGHAEGASGVISLIKILVMMHGRFIPPQASFSTMSHHIRVGPGDMMEVPTTLRTWDDEYKVALINNYGASGSNASMLVTQPPRSITAGRPSTSSTSSSASSAAQQPAPRFPFWITGLDARSIGAYCAKLAEYLDSPSLSSSSSSSPPSLLADLSFHVNRQSNRSLPKGLVFTARSVAELRETLHRTASAVAAAAEDKDSNSTLDANSITPTPAERPIILCFGGQVSTHIGLDPAVYRSITLLRHHLDACDAAARSQGLGSIYPGIFAREPVADTVALQTMLFALQYATARCWTACLHHAGATATATTTTTTRQAPRVAALVGHSFGEITALCVAGVLSLDDAVRLVAGRARLVRDAWGADPGAMLAVEAEDEGLVRELLAEANHIAAGSTIACYNSPRSWTLAGPTAAVDAVVEVLSRAGAGARFGGIKSKRLRVSNAFHSVLVEPLTAGLEEVGRGLTFREPVIALERATETRSAGPLDATFVASHMRQPVYFNHAVQRLARDYPAAIFLEAGSNSTVTAMAGRALANAKLADPQRNRHFQAVSITDTDKGLDNLANATTALWEQGLRVSFWPHHAVQAQEYSALFLPPYQFEKARHWMELKSPLEAVHKAAAALAPQVVAAEQGGAGQSEKTLGLWTFAGYQDDGNSRPRFRINTGSDRYRFFISGHVIAQTAPICPATLEVDMAIEALFSLHPDWRADGLQPAVLDMVNHAPICVDSSRAVWLDFEQEQRDATIWAWRITSTTTTGTDAGAPTTTHVEARLHMRNPADAAYTAEFARFERLVSHERCVALLSGAAVGDEDDEVEVLRGVRNVYRAFDEIVDYGELYRGVRAVVRRWDECAGRVVAQHRNKAVPAEMTWLDVPLSDCFSQVAGVWVNCMTDHAPGDMYIATGCELAMRSPRPHARESVETWHVFARHTRQSDKVYVSDVFVFDAGTGLLAEVMLGIQYARVAKASMSKMLTRLTGDPSVLRTTTAAAPTTTHHPAATAAPSVLQPQPHADGAPGRAGKQKDEKKGKKKKKAKAGRPDITDDVRNLVANVSGIEASDITPDSELADFGIDSLMGMELAREVEVVFKCKLDQEELMEATSLRKFVVCISNALFGRDGGAAAPEDRDDEDEDEEEDESSSFSSSIDASTAPSTPPEAKAEPEGKPSSAVANAPPAVSSLTLHRDEILQSFGEVKMLCDQHLRDFHLDNVDHDVIMATNRLSAALVVEAFDELGSPLRTAVPGQTIPPVPFQPQHGRLMHFVYTFLERDARLVDIDPATKRMTRTHIAPPRRSSVEVLQELLATYPEFVVANKLTHYAGRHLADVLSGKTDGIRVLFGTAEARELTQALYCEHTFNRMNYGQMRDVVARLMARIPAHRRTGETLKILEMGAGTGGTTYVLAPLLAGLDIAVEYTFTDLSPSMVANARRKFGKQYPFMRFAVHDIEKPPAEELRGQHLVLASNAIHATHSLVQSLANVRSALRPDGFLMMLEMTEVVPFIDLIFGLLEGWWLFDDGRAHAIVSAEHWERELRAAGFGHVDWTDGSLPENRFQKVVIALASGAAQEKLPKPEPSTANTQTPSSITILNGDASQLPAVEREAEAFVAKYTADWFTPALAQPASNSNKETATANPKKQPIPGTTSGAIVILTGATGSLGAHLAAALASHPGVQTVVCLNRARNMPAEQRQREAFASRGIVLSPGAPAKLRVLATADFAKPRLGLPDTEYDWLAANATHIVHNAWPMSGTRVLAAFEGQFRALRGLLDLAREMASRPNDEEEGGQGGYWSKVGFQLVSSIGVVGCSGEAVVRERRVPLASALPVGYCQAKWVCERMLDKTMHRFPERFRAAVVRPGQIAGSRTSGVWNPVEHFAFLVKSAQALRAWPDLDGVLQWVPVNDVAGAMVDLLAIPAEGKGSAGPAEAEPYPVYHIDNPVGQPWKEMSPVLAEALGIPPDRLVPFRDWITLVRRAPLVAETENPAARLVDFLEHHFERMSCGGLILDTTLARQHSRTMAELGPVSTDVARRFVAAWKSMGFLTS